MRVQDNKQEYVDLVVEYKTTRSIAEPLDSLKAGFYDVVPWEAIRIFSVDGTSLAQRCLHCGCHATRLTQWMLGARLLIPLRPSQS